MSSKITRAANGRQCMIRVPGFCVWQPTVACHWRDAAMSGKGEKCPDLLSAWGCPACHAIVDSYGASIGMDRNEARRLHAEGIMRTQYRLIKDGVIRV